MSKFAKMARLPTRRVLCQYPEDNNNDLNKVADKWFSFKQWFAAGAPSCRLRIAGFAHCNLMISPKMSSSLRIRAVATTGDEKAMKMKQAENGTPGHIQLHRQLQKPQRFFSLTPLFVLNINDKQSTLAFSISFVYNNGEISLIYFCFCF